MISSMSWAFDVSIKWARHTLPTNAEGGFLAGHAIGRVVGRLSHILNTLDEQSRNGD